LAGLGTGLAGPAGCVLLLLFFHLPDFKNMIQYTFYDRLSLGTLSQNSFHALATFGHQQLVGFLVV
jgi:hypothetical protein